MSRLLFFLPFAIRHLYEDCTFLNTIAAGKKFPENTVISSQTNYLDLTLIETIATARKSINSL